MSRDLTIYGVNTQGLSFKEEHITDQILDFVRGLDYEHWESKGICEIITFRSKSLCLAISQIVNDLIEHGYAVLDGVKIHSEIGVNDMVLSKSDILSVVYWLVLTSEAMGEIWGKNRSNKHNHEVQSHFALEVVRKTDFAGDEFEWYWFEKELFQQWYNIIKNSSFEYYYWEDSY
jgi:hypothetical protein